MKFVEILKQELGAEWPKNPKFSAITNRIIVSQKDYARLQITFTWGNYNMWCTGMNKNIDPNKDSSDILPPPVANYIESGDAKNFKDLFITENEARIEAEEAAAQEKNKN